MNNAKLAELLFPNIEKTPEEIRMLHSVIIAVSHIIFLNYRFQVVRNEKE